jgi:hypothetical protein
VAPAGALVNSGFMASSVTEVVIPLTVRDLTAEDLPSCAWSGGATHLASVARALERARRGEVDYLAVCPPSGLPIAIGGVDYRFVGRAGPRRDHLPLRDHVHADAQRAVIVSRRHGCSPRLAAARLRWRHRVL